MNNPVSDELQDAWRSDPRCVECGEAIGSAGDAALLVGPDRVAHRVRCFVPALLRANPLLKLLAAQPGAQEVNISPLIPLERRADASATELGRRAAGGGHG